MWYSIGIVNSFKNGALSMKMSYVIAILATLAVYDKLSGGDGTNLANVVFWSCVPRSTCYRYLQKMQSMGYVTTREGKHRKQDATLYNISKSGKTYLEGVNRE